ncbi:pantothenate synthetase [Tistrella bauzanensis]|uniref:Pantothenate synthetase n=1 Tax=Tistrella bauzanensis TaxID=657419 RepID=A0ABQ1IGN5_9PROT|nr:pantoate--beta-alanine ligase [Tistrella bauzanensis]GGB40457.1 pantothenate synthetase [Tistrella bauzanensis]
MSPTPIDVVHDRADLRGRVGRWRRRDQRVALVPTMGALHDGHLSLVDLARGAADRVVVSIFVNPTQFGPGEDFERYPRDDAGDIAKLARAGADLVWMPRVTDMYRPDAATTVHVDGLTDGLCGPLRPGHFDGVATVVAKLLIGCAPDVAVFGEKDWQQLQVIRRMAADLDLPVTIIGAPTSREPSGLARSSRNVYLSAGERPAAEALNQVLTDVAGRLTAADIDDTAAVPAAIAAGIARLQALGYQQIQYLQLVDATTLVPLTLPPPAGRPARLLVAAILGTTRLIDNIPVVREELPGYQDRSVRSTAAPSHTIS